MPSRRASAAGREIIVAPVSTRNRTLPPFTWPTVQNIPPASALMVTELPVPAARETYGWPSRSVRRCPSTSNVAVSRSTATSSTPSGERCPTLSVRGWLPLIDTTALLPNRPTTLRSVAAAGPASARASPSTAIQSARFMGKARAMKPIAIFRQSSTEGPGYFAAYLDAQRIPWRVVRVDQGEPVPTDPRAFAGLVFMGGPMSVNDDLAWIPGELELIRRAVDAEVPCPRPPPPRAARLGGPAAGRCRASATAAAGS